MVYDLPAFEADNPLGRVLSLADARRETGAPEGADMDALLTRLIVGAEAKVEEITGRLLAARTARLRRRQFPRGGDPISLPGGVVVSVASVAYTDTAGSAATVAADSVALDSGGRRPALLWPASGAAWPMARDDGAPSIVVTYTAGYAGEGSPPDYGVAVPQPLRDAALMLVIEGYAAGRAVGPDGMTRRAYGLDHILSGWKLRRVG
jgi:uncharacterized phiE125 gp8 family phage protein